MIPLRNRVFGPVTTLAFNARIRSLYPVTTRIDRALVAAEYRSRLPRAYAAAILTTARTIPVAVRVLTGAHVHVSSESRDCDGRMDRAYSYAPRNRLAWARETVTSPIAILRDVEPGIVTVSGWSVDTFRRTDEGYSWMSETVCRDDDGLGEYSQRDHSAEAMGY